jgi:hypothetical protein
MKIKKYGYISVFLGLSLGLLVLATPAFAQTGNISGSEGSSGWSHGMGLGHGKGMGMRKPGVFGTVSAISGNTLTISSKQFFGLKLGAKPSTNTSVYTVDASNATIMKNNSTSTISSVAVGDMIMAQGTINGTNVSATVIRDGMPMRDVGKNSENEKLSGQNPPQILGNGQPVSGNYLNYKRIEFKRHHY